MEKQSKKLILSQETLRNLSAGELRTVVGGFFGPSLQGTCQCTTAPNNTCQHSVCFGTCNPAEMPRD